MTVLPIVGRELRVAARRPATYRIRFFTAFVMGIVFGGMLLIMVRDQVAPARQGNFLFQSLTVAAFIYSLLAGVIVTSDCVSSEKRDGTLGLLFLTDLKGYDVILGKLSASSINSFYGLLGVIPLIGIPMLLGGVTTSVFGLTAALLMNNLILSLSVGILVSTFSVVERKAMMFTFLVLILITIGPWPLAYWLTEGSNLITMKSIWIPLLPSPFYVLIVNFGNLPPGAPAASVWYSMATTFCLSVVCLTVASLRAPVSWKTKIARVKSWSPNIIRNISQRLRQPNREFRTRLLQINPFFWLAVRHPYKQALVWLFVASMFLIWITGYLRHGRYMYEEEVLLTFIFSTHFLLKLWVAGEACTRMAEDRRSGSLELLLSTPLSTRKMISGQMLALRHLFLKPVLLLVASELWIVFFSLQYSDEEGLKIRILLSVIMLVADLWTLGWLGMWLGLKSRGVNRSIATALWWVLAVPTVVALIVQILIQISFLRIVLSNQSLVFIYLPLVIGLLTDLILVFLWARPRLLSRFREVAVHEQRSLWTRVFGRPEKMGPEQR